MKKIIDGFRKIIRFIVTIFASREFAFIYCLIGCASQIAHTYFLTDAISSFHGGFKTFQAVLMSTFISSSLLYFVAIADNSDTKESKRIHLAVNVFMIIEILINTYYYCRHLIIDAAEIKVFDFIFAILVSCLIPVTIKLYASQIRAKEWFEEEFGKEGISAIDNLQVDEKINEGIQKFVDENQIKYEKLLTAFDDLKSTNNSQTIEEFEDLLNKKFEEFKANVDSSVIDKEEIQEWLKEQLEAFKSEINKNIDEDVSNIFEKSRNLLLQQFENKCKLIMNKFKPE